MTRREETVIVTARIERTLAQRIDALCEQYNWSRSALVAHMLEHMVREMAPVLAPTDPRLLRLAEDILAGRIATTEQKGATL